MNTTKVLLKGVRFSFAHVFQPQAMVEGQPKKYSVSVLLDKVTDKDLIEQVKEAVKLAYEQGVGKFGGKLPTEWKNPLRDGDTAYPDSEAYQGKMFFNASSTTKPGVVKPGEHGVVEITEESGEFYSGCFGAITVNFYAFNASGSKGVAGGLGNICKTKDGERLSGGASASEDFGDFKAEDDLMG